MLEKYLPIHLDSLIEKLQGIQSICGDIACYVMMPDGMYPLNDISVISKKDSTRVIFDYRDPVFEFKEDKDFEDPDGEFEKFQKFVEEGLQF